MLVVIVSLFSLITNALLLAPISASASTQTWNFGTNNTQYDYDGSKLTLAGDGAKLTNPGAATGASVNLNPGTGVKSDGAADFSAANKEYLTIADATQTNLDPGTSDFAISMWVQPQSSAANLGLFSKGITADADPGYGINTDGSGKVHVSFGDGVGSRLSGGGTGNPLITAVWTHIIANFDRDSNVTIYANGQSIATMDISGHQASINSVNPFFLGSYQGPAGNLFNGQIDSVGFWSRTLTSGEISSLYNSGNGRIYSDLSTSDKTNLVSWWNLNEESGTRFDSVDTSKNHLAAAAGKLIQPATYGSELISNGGFETYTGTQDDGATDTLTSWVNDLYGGVIESTATAHSGSNAVKVTNVNNPSTRLLRDISGLTAGASYQLTFWTRGDGSNSGRYGVYDVNNAADIITTTNGGVTGTTYILKTIQFTLPAGCTHIYIFFYAPATTGGIAYFDDVSVKQITTAAINNGDFETKGNGLVLGAEKLGNTDFETVTGSDFGTWTENVGSGAIADEGSLVHAGSHAAKITAGSGATAYIHQSISGVSAGQTFKFTFWTRGDGTNAGRYGVYDVTNSAYFVPTTSTGVTGTTYTQVTITFTVPTNCTSINVQLLAPSANGGIAYFDDVSLKQYTTYAPFANWVASMQGTSTVNDETDPNNVYSGAHAFRMDIDSNNNGYGAYQSILTNGRKYKSTVYAKANSGTPSIKVGTYNANNTSYTVTTSYAQYTTYFTADTTGFQLARNSANSASVYFDSVTLESIGPLAAAGIAAGVSQDANFAAQLNGSSQFFSLADNTSLSVGDIDFEVGAWVYFDSMPAGSAGIISKTSGSTAATEEYFIYYTGGATGRGWLWNRTVQSPGGPGKYPIPNSA